MGSRPARAYVRTVWEMDDDTQVKDTKTEDEPGNDDTKPEDLKPEEDDTNLKPEVDDRVLVASRVEHAIFFWRESRGLTPPPVQWIFQHVDVRSVGPALRRRRATSVYGALAGLVALAAS